MYARLRYTGGQIVDFDKLYRDDPDAREYEWVVPAYLLHFTIEFGVDPAERYCAEISLDAEGNVLEDIPLPRTAVDPGLLAIILKARALEVAATHDVPVSRATTALVYVPACDCLEWMVGYDVESEPGHGRRKILHLNACDPSKYRWSEEVWVD